VVDVEDDHPVVRVVDAVAESVLSAASAPQSFEGRTQRNPDRARSSAEWSADELTRRESRGGRKRFGERSTRPGRKDDGVRGVVWRLTCHGARAAAVHP
jgi:hypothetical protein